MLTATIGLCCFVAGMLVVQVTRYERLRIAERQLVTSRCESAVLRERCEGLEYELDVLLREKAGGFRGRAS